MVELRALFADDKARVEAESVQDAVSRSLSRSIPGVVIEWDAEDRRRAAIDRLAKLDMRLDIALIDAIWAPMLRGEYRDLARDLLSKALSRSETVVVLISDDSSKLLDYLSNDALAEVRPHGVLSKELMDDEGYVDGAIDAAFAAKRQQLRALGSRFVWTAEVSGIHRKLAVEELTARAFGPVVSAEITPIGGGFSDTETVLVNGRGQRGSSPAGVVRGMLKVASNPEILTTEVIAHREFVRRFPSGTFARPHEGKVYRYGDWAAMLFEHIDGYTLSSVKAEAIADGSLSRIFPGLLFKFYVENSAPVLASTAELICGEGGILHSSRWLRVGEAADELGLPDELVSVARGSAASAFSDMTGASAVTLVHGDLHTRNVLRQSDGRYFWVDAASIRIAGVWCEDLSRFVVWLLCEFVDEAPRDVGVGTIIELLTFGCGLGPGDAGPFESWTHAIRAFVASSLDTFAAEFRSARKSVNVVEDWGQIVLAELLRASYSRLSFSPRTRTAAAQLALSLLRG